MSSLFPNSNQEGAQAQQSKFQVRAFEKDEPSPFRRIDFDETYVYELTDYTFRTPLEKMDVFNSMLDLPHDCELWILPVTEETTALLEDLPKDGTYEKTASLFNMLSTIKETVERDRSFIVAKRDVCESVVAKLAELGFTLKQMKKDEIRDII